MRKKIAGRENENTKARHLGSPRVESEEAASSMQPATDSKEESASRRKQEIGRENSHPLGEKLRNKKTQHNRRRKRKRKSSKKKDNGCCN